MNAAEVMSKLFSHRNEGKSFVITDMSLIIDHVILEYVNQILSEYGISLIFVEDVIESLPEHVDTIIDYLY